VNHRGPEAVADQVERSDDTRAGLVGAGDQRVQPARLDVDVVVDVDGVRRRDRARQSRARFMRPQRLVEARDVEPPARRVRRERFL
jgi:hypothetical protein